MCQIVHNLKMVIQVVIRDLWTEMAWEIIMVKYLMIDISFIWI